MAYRSSTGALDVYEDERRPPPARWDRDKFERYSRAEGPPPGPPPVLAPPPERGGSLHFEEHDRYGPRGEHHDIEIDERYGRPQPTPPRAPRYVDDLDDDRGFRRRPTDFLEEPLPPEVANRALAPYRPQPSYDSPGRRPSRPSYIRRQSSLDTFDRKPYPRYGDYEQDDGRGFPPISQSQALAIPARTRSGRRSGPQFDEQWEEVQFREDDDPSVWEEDYRDIRIRRKRSRHRRQRSSSPSSSASSTTRMSGTTAKSGKSHKSRRSSTTKKSHHHRRHSKSHKSTRKSRSAVRYGESVRSSSTSSSSSESSVMTAVPTKRGRTKMPKRLVHVRAVVELGYPYYEEGDFIMVRRALTKPQIDEVIKSSEKYIDKMTTYRYEHSGEIYPPPPESVTSSGTGYREHRNAHSRRSRSHSRRRRSASIGSYASGTTVTANYEHRSNHGHGSHPYNTIVSPPPTIRPRSRSRSRSRTIQNEYSSHVAGPLVVLTPEQQQRRREVEIREDMRTMEIAPYRERDRVEYDELVVRDPPRDVVRVEKDRKGRMALVRSTH